MIPEVAGSNPTFTGRGNSMYEIASSSDILGGGWSQKPVWVDVEEGGWLVRSDNVITPSYDSRGRRLE